MTKGNQKDLDTLWVCADCGTASLYHSDIEEHKQENNHRHIAEFDLNTGRILTHRSQ